MTGLLATIILVCGCGGAQPGSDAIVIPVTSEVLATQTAAVSVPTAAPPPTRSPGDDDSWYECFWGANELWIHAEEAFGQVTELVEANRGEGCGMAPQIADQFDKARTAWDRCPLPSNPALREFDRLSREALAYEGLGSMYFILWCEIPGDEAWHTMLYFRSEAARLAQEAQDILEEAD